jgi:uncharacterized protein (TIGR03089 family)
MSHDAREAAAVAAPGTATTLAEALAAAVARDGARPLITWIGPEGARTELSVRTFENNVAKAANLLQDDAGTVAGSRVTLHLPPHWQTAVWLGACAAAGATAWLGGDDGDPRVVLSVLGPEAAATTAAPTTLAVSLHPFGLPTTAPLPPGVLDAAVEVRAHGDRFAAYDPPTGASPWLVDGDWAWTNEQALAAGRELADGFGVAQGGRVLVRASSPAAGYRFAGAVLALPLAVDGSVVLVTDPAADPDEVSGSERCAVALDLDG